MSSPVWVLVVFLLVIVSLILTTNLSPRFKIPSTNIFLTVTYTWPPVIGVILLFITVQMPFMDMLDAGLFGVTTAIKPYAIMLLILSMAFICIALDFTGAFSYVAFRCILKYVKSKYHLFLIMYIFSVFFGAIASSHIVVMTLTPLILHITHFTQVSALPYLYSAFYGANLASLALIIGNPTNIIIGSAFQVTFIDFLKIMIIPSFAVIMTGYIALILQFYSDLGLTLSEVFCCGLSSGNKPPQQDSSSTPPPTIGSHIGNSFIQVEVAGPPITKDLTLPNIDPHKELRDPIGAILHSIVLVLSIFMMALSSLADGIELFMVSCVGAAVSLIYVVVRYPLLPSNIEAKATTMRTKMTKSNQTTSLTNINPPAASSSPCTEINDSLAPQLSSTQPVLPTCNDDSPNSLKDESESVPTQQNSSYSDKNLENNEYIADYERQTNISPNGNDIYLRNDSVGEPHFVVDSIETIPHDDKDTIGEFTCRELCTWNILSNLPYDVPVFIFCMFILVQALVNTNWIEDVVYKVFALCGGAGAISEESLLSRDALHARCVIIIIIFSFVSLILSNLMSAQPAAIFLTQVVLVSNNIVIKYQQDMGYEHVPGLDPRYQMLMVYTLIAGSNISSVLTLVGSLSGLIFSKIVNAHVAKNLKRHNASPTLAFFNDKITYGQFTFKGIKAIPFLLLALCIFLFFSALLFTDA